jgi:hypothetical protein
MTPHRKEKPGKAVKIKDTGIKEEIEVLVQRKD